MTSSLAARRPHPTFTPTQSTDEGYLNRSLLDNIDAQGDAEPVSSSDSEAAGASATTFGSLSTASSVGSPSMPYHISMQSQLVPRADSPNHAFVNHLKSPQHSTDFFHQGSQNNTIHSMYNSVHSVGLPTSDYSLSSTEPDALNFASRANGSFAAAPVKTSTSFTSFPNRSRHPTSFRESTNTFPSTYPTSNNLFGASQNSMSHLAPSQSQAALPHGLDSLQHAGRSYDFTPGGPQLNGGLNGSSQSKPLFVDPFRQGLDATPTLLQKQQGGVSSAQSLLQNGQTLNHQHPYQTSFANGLGSHPLTHGSHPQPQYGLQLVSSGSGPGQNSAQGGGATSAPSMNHANGPAPSSQVQEEISTIFVVGFPDDMSEREFQNMFTFSSGFEAATLKIPNKESTSYGNANGQGARQGPSLPFGGNNDPYNLVGMNQGGALIDGARDGMASWPSAGIPDDGHFMQNNMAMQPPRKQIIGFAKFRTRAEALEARDVLQGRRVDVEKGAVLKAEMAKKNLHTKRGPGVGPLGLPSFPSGVPGAAGPDNMSGLPGLPAAGEALTQRDKQLGALGAMGIDLNGFGQRRDRMFDGRDDDDRDRRRGDFSSVGLGAYGSRGPRERAEEDERERKRREKEKEVARARQNSYAFEAFHSVPQQMVRQGANSLLSAENGNGMASHGPNLPSSPPSGHNLPSQPEGLTGPWGNLRDVSASAALRKMGVPQHHLSGLPARPPSPSATSPPMLEAMAIRDGHSAPTSRGLFSPDSVTSSLPSHPSLPTRPHPQSPSSEPQSHSIHGPFGQTSSLPNSKASSVSGSLSGHEEELVRSVGALAVSTESGSTSPQLPSPASGTSSGGGRTGSDQNPPINTLYVGNLPTSTSPGGHTLSYLEDRLRELFSKQPGYRKLCFRQKSNGPMCFVEFENVEYATQALTGLYGANLDGLVRNGGIRLSYSKNPLGVRTPNSGGNGPSLQQQQHQHSREVSDGNRDPGFPGDTYTRHADSADTIRAIRRDTSGMTSPTSSYHYTTSPPPPRFFSPPLPSGTFGGPLATSTSFPRANPQGFGFPSGTSPFSPFGIPHTSIPDQPSADASNDHLAHLTPATAI
ncbi:hypothetical protein K466DRAFT_92857 [Polyporus arcularius HHB13444]|uniref:RRM domain-containing protein n=1 Tax=Polyporus arcularius HHB13444 TaxID=1314778 RepID=A0A5C3PVT3_9APHY|nr:hypothetical protein K466DRAFT_92857 [Polyporus arcularius HHB13444]